MFKAYRPGVYLFAPYSYRCVFCSKNSGRSLTDCQSHFARCETLYTILTAAGQHRYLQKEDDTECSKYFHTKRELDCHIIEYHRDHDLKYVTHEIYECEVCGFRTLDKERMRAHLRMSINDPDELIGMECLLCSFGTSSKRQLIKHYNDRHKLNKKKIKFRCPECRDYEFEGKVALDLHFIVDHREELKEKFAKYVTIC